MIYDCFLFFNEFKILRLRLEELNEVVDQFVLVESTRTFSNDPKPLFFDQNKQAFGQWALKIRHVVVEEMPQGNPAAWDIERFQRNAILRGLEDASPDDLIVISDVDEIPRAKVLSSFSGNLAALELDHFYYKLNCKNLKRRITGPMLIRGQHLTNPQTVRERARRYWEDGTTVVPNAGWHFSCMSDPAGIKLKLKSFSHQEYNTPEFTDIDAIANRIKYGLDVVGRADEFWCCVPLDSSFPRYLLENREAFSELIADFEEFHVNRQRLILELYGQLRKAEEEMARINKEVSQLKTQLQGVVQSKSWRTTEPLRQIVGRVRKLLLRR